MTAAVLAVQGAFAEHEQKLDELGINHIELRERADLDRDFDALILPGGESTVQGKLLRELGMFDELKDRIKQGLPVLATCAGMILLAESIENDDRQYFATLPVTVRRNAYGRQLGSFFTEAQYDGLGKVPQTYIRRLLSQRSQTASRCSRKWTDISQLSDIRTRRRLPSIRS